ncbi:MAG TPA: DUF202 domain-containing protein [Gaiellaceae bacterium]|jgi:inner membrane protein YidH|nr:DUF202 domain-containing protein [Gaiellaceae bacterium]
MTAVDETGDAIRRTRLANERTYLAWWRTGLASLAVAVGAGRIAPALAGGTTWPYEVIGIAFAAVGLSFIGYAYARQRQVEAALARGEFARFGDRPALVFTLLGTALGIATVVLVLVHPS